VVVAVTAPVLHVATTTALHRDGLQVHEVFHGLLREGSVKGREVWRCDHPHPKRPGARACAGGELRQRALPEMKGNWDGWTSSVRDCLAPGGYRQMPVCPLCAKSLLHTKAEHDRLEPSVTPKELQRRDRIDR